MPIVLLIFSILMNTPGTRKEVSSLELIYVGDPMCSWCYGITEEWNQLMAAFPDAKVQYIMGGLRPNGTESMASLKSFLKEHWIEINQRTGMPFKFDILQRDMVYNTEPACRAVVAFRHFNAANTGVFFKNIQKAFYAENHNPYLATNYADLAEKLGVDRGKYLTYFHSAAAEKETISDFEMAADLGVSGFPTILAKVRGSIYVISQGYQTTTAMRNTIHQLLNE